MLFLFFVDSIISVDEIESNYISEVPFISTFFSDEASFISKYMSGYNTTSARVAPNNGGDYNGKTQGVFPMTIAIFVNDVVPLIPVPNPPVCVPVLLPVALDKNKGVGFTSDIINSKSGAR